MSALWEYVECAERQADLLECAEIYDDVYCCESPEAAHVTRASGSEHRRHWTRQDRNRAECEYALQELDGQNLPISDFLREHHAIAQRWGRMGTRLGRFLTRFAQPAHSVRRTFHPPALAEAQRLGIFNTVAPLLVETTEAHTQLLEAYRRIEEIDFTDAQRRHRDAIRNLKLHLPAPTAGQESSADIGSDKKSRPTGKTVDIIRDIQNDVDYNTIVTNHHTTIQNVRQIASRLQRNMYRL